MQGDDPPYLSVGTAVSAKYKGAFCEAKVSKVVRIVKCKVTYKMGLGTATVSDEHIKGTLRVGQLVQAKHPDKKDFVDATITKIQDCSQYTVVFDDGDITTLRRTALCLKSGRHFNESETLDQLPLTHPEHFGNPVVGGRRGRRSRQLKEDSSEGEIEEENEPDLELYSADIGRVVSVESSEKKRNKDNWFPGLIVMPSAQPTVKINVKDEFLVRSFKDGRYYTVPKKEVTEFTRELGARVESSHLMEAVEKALKYLDEDELPVHWEKNSLFNTQSQYSDSEENFTDSSDDEPREEKDHFVAQLYKFMDDAGTPLKSPLISNKDVDLYRLFRVVQKLGGYNRVTNQNKWRSIASRLKFANNQNTSNQIKIVYRKCLYTYEGFYRTLGCTMSDHTRSAKKNRGRSLIRDKDRVTPVQSPRPDKEEVEIVDKKEEDEKAKVRKPDVVKKDSDDEKRRVFENSESSSDNADIPEPIASVSKEIGRPKRTDLVKTVKEKKPKTPVIDKVVKVAEKIEAEVVKKEEKEDEKIQQQTRSKAQILKVVKDTASPDRKMREQKVSPQQDPTSVNKIVINKIPKRNSDEEKKRGRKRINAEEKTNSDSNVVVESVIVTPTVNIGDKLKVYYGPTHESKVTYEAKVIEIDRDQHEPIYLVHYTGWNTRYDEWIAPVRIAENLSATTKAKRLKQGSIVTATVTTATATTTTTTTTTTVTKVLAVASTSAASSTNPVKVAGKRGRGISITGKTTVTADPPRSTTPSSVTSSSSRTKSPATPITRNNRITRQVSGELGRRTRRTSVQTDVSVQSDSDTVETESESEQSKIKIKSEGSDGKLPRKKLTKTKSEKRKDDEDTEKEEDSEKSKKTVRKVKKTPTNIKSLDESDDENTNPPKGRDFDLNQIRSELKGFTKIKMTSAENSSDKEITGSLSDEFTSVLEVKSLPEEDDEDDDVDKKEKLLESTSSSDDVYEFKEPEPFEFEKIIDEKSKKRLVPRVLETVEKSPKKKSPKMTTKIESKDADDKKRYKRSPVKKDDGDNELDKEQQIKLEDPFDKLVESPSFHIHKPSLSDKKPDDFKKVVKTLNLDEPLNLFEELPMSVDDNVERLDISDSEDLQSEPFFTHKELFSTSTFSKESPDHNIDSDCVGFTPKSDDRKPTTSDDEDIIQATMQTVLTFDNDSNDTLLINQPSVSYEMLKRKESLTVTVTQAESEEESKLPEIFSESKDTQEKIASLSRQLAPVFQETDSALLKDLCSQPTQFLTKSEDIKEINVKTGTKIADTILQKLNMIKNKDCKPVVKTETVVEKEEPPPTVESDVENIDVKSETEEDDLKCNESIEMKVKSPEPKMKLVETKLKSEKLKVEHDLKRRPSRKVLSREFVDETDSDSSDSGERLIMDEDSQTSLSLDMMKPDVKESDSNGSLLKADVQEIEEPKHNFKFDYILQSGELKDEVNMETECLKEDEPDSHSLLLCEETIPGSPAPAPMNEVKQKMKNELEMPFASAPSSSNNKNIIINDHKNINKERVVPPPLSVNLDNPENRDASAVLDNTPPTTPESTISNLSPRGENGGLSPNTVDNESCKSTEAEGDYSNQRRISTSKVSPYSEEDTLMNIESGSTKKRDEMVPSPCKKRRRSCKALDEIPAKRGRKPNNRSRHNSDSDDTSEHSAQGITNISSTTSIESRLTRSPKPSKYNFYVEFDPSLDSAQRIAVLQQKLTELRKTYANVKAELAAIERRRKKIRRRDREAAKAAKQEMTAACT